MIERRWRQLLIFAAVALGTAALFWVRPKTPRTASAPVAPPAATALAPGVRTSAPVPAFAPGSPASQTAPAPLAAPAPAAEPMPEGESGVADDLGASGGTIQRDLTILEEVFGMWLTNFPRTGNPVGENAEITAALTGDNPVKFAFIPRRHRAINTDGELCDRWGTPFRFHQISGRQMEIRSAGPDRKFGTTDDASIGSPE